MTTQALQQERASAVFKMVEKDGLLLSPEQQAELRQFVDLLLEWNARVNLISRKDQGNVWESHILHSLSVALCVSFPSGIRVLDLGSGGGLPGIPLAIARPDLHITLLDSIKKKTAAAEDMINRLPIGNVDVITSRAEDLPKREGQGASYDVVVARAVAPLIDLIKWSKPLLRMSQSRTATVQGADGQRQIQTPFLLTLKGGDLEDELRHAHVRYPAVPVTAIPVKFHNLPNGGLEDKKILIAQP